jgi:hypothetical protein
MIGKSPIATLWVNVFIKKAEEKQDLKVRKHGGKSGTITLRICWILDWLFAD